jgi:hypothetical protein
MFKTWLNESITSKFGGEFSEKWCHILSTRYIKTTILIVDNCRAIKRGQFENAVTIIVLFFFFTKLVFPVIYSLG